MDIETGERGGLWISNFVGSMFAYQNGIYLQASSTKSKEQTFKTIGIDANRSNSLYGGRNTVQPNSTRVTYLIKFV